tara:strand:+ start:225 stop:638 length:414 start_codon:yes stop_codon:yes gene_type:complete
MNLPNLAEYNLIIGDNIMETIPFACIADLTAAAYIINLFTSESVRKSLGNSGHIDVAPSPYCNRSLASVNWTAVRGKLDMFLAHPRVLANSKDCLKLETMLNFLIPQLELCEQGMKLREVFSKENLDEILYNHSINN